ncbi:MAG TPA: hypothetical protein DD666_00500 [Advenella kashmirensis]|uniref:Uncharacterized protein n=1 Tax=Advenella kashmirensis TaxID=310575 RepID=A0A356LAM9_9BURK|nr:hypothetical protein [Advenella kashmirensis]
MGRIEHCKFIQHLYTILAHCAADFSPLLQLRQVRLQNHIGIFIESRSLALIPVPAGLIDMPGSDR